MPSIFKNRLLLLMLFVSVLIYSGCSSSPESIEKRDGEQVKKTETNTDTIYVFDKVPVADPPTENDPNTDPIPSDNKETEEINPSGELVTKYAVQIGAYSTLEKADEIANEARKKLKKEISVTYDESTKLFVIRLASHETKAEAEKQRNELWKMKEFKDAFIVTVNESK